MSLFCLTEPELRERTSMKWRTFSKDVLPLFVAEMDLLPHRSVRDAVVAAMEAGDTGYPVGTKYADAYADMAQQRWGWRPADAQLRRAGDVMNAIGALLLGNTSPGDHVVINPPVYPPFWQVIQGYRRHITEVPLTASGRLNLQALADAFAGPDSPAAYVLCSPHNPTGTVHTVEELTAVAQLCRDHGVVLIVDEIHAVLVDPEVSFVPILSLPQAQNAVVVFSAGKGWNLAALKGGLFIAGTEASGIVDKLPPLANQSTGQLATIAHTAALQHAQDWVDQVMVEVAAHKDLLESLLGERLPGVTWQRHPGTYLAWLDCTALGLSNPAEHFVRHAQVALNDGATFGADYSQYVRLNLATSPQLIERAVDRLASSL